MAWNCVLCDILCALCGVDGECCGRYDVLSAQGIYLRWNDLGVQGVGHIAEDD